MAEADEATRRLLGRLKQLGELDHASGVGNVAVVNAVQGTAMWVKQHVSSARSLRLRTATHR